MRAVIEVFSQKLLVQGVSKFLHRFLELLILKDEVIGVAKVQI